MNNITIGLIPAPGFPAEVASQLQHELTSGLANDIDHDVTWQIEMTIDPLTGAAEYIDEVMQKATVLKQAYGWDYAICLTDLPIFANGHLVTADASVKNGVAQISLPSFGAMPSRSRIHTSMIQMVGELYYRSSPDDAFVNASLNQKRLLHKNGKITNIYKRQFALGDVQRIYPSPNARDIDIRFILKSQILGWSRVVSGMTFANRPWKALFSFKQALALAFSTGAYISFFSTPWQLSLHYTLPRFILLALISMIGMVVWVILSHNLWEKPNGSDRRLSRLYNYTTVITLSTIVLTYYLILFAAFSMALFLFVPPHLFEGWTGLDREPSILDYLQLVWFVTSLGTIAGAIGTGLQHEDKIREITYSYRQKHRKYEMEEQKDVEEQSS